MLISTDSRLSFEKSRSGREGVTLPADNYFKERVLDVLPEGLMRKRPLLFPELSSALQLPLLSVPAAPHHTLLSLF